MGWGLSVDNQQEINSYRAMGEAQYVQQHARMASAIIRSNPKEFMERSIKRMYFFWASTPHPLAKSAFLEIPSRISLLLLEHHRPARLGAWPSRKKFPQQSCSPVPSCFFPSSTMP